MRTLEAKILDSTHLELSEPISSPVGQHIPIVIPDHGGVDATSGGRTPDAGTDHSSASSVSGPNRDLELAWCRSHEDELQALAGQWVILEGEVIVVHGHEPAKLVEQAWGKGIQVPFIFYVEEFHPDVVKMGLF